ncbi:hypothetical protein ACF0H5_013687 [Mactra antiquata]
MSAVMERLLLIGVILAFISGTECDRKVTTSIKHGCYNNTEDACGSYGYIEAVGEQDTLHYLVSTLGLPTIFVAYTDKDVTAQVDLDKLLSPNVTERQDTVTFTPSSGVKYSYSMAFTKLIDYNDTKDKADMTQYSPSTTAYNVYDLGDFMWKNISVTSTPENNVIVFEAAPSNNYDDLWLSNGTFSIQLTAFSKSGREDNLPHLQYNENLTQFDLNIDHLYTNLSKSRFAVEIALIGDNAKQMHVDETRSIDDEYTPGVFTIYNWLTDEGDDKGFLQWKPVCYKSLQRSRAEATGMKHYGMRLSTDIDPYMNTLVYGYYGDNLINTMINVGNFSFGLSQDGGYNKTQVLTWSGSIGYGVPPADAISKLVIIIISAGLGLPVVLIIFGGIFVCIKKRNQPVEKPLRSIQGQGYQPLPEN